ncbi:OmpA family protein [Bacteroidales bacterium OttesenSCG-928-M06]|nr:OmpA family protein [Bacteroidales bacterium OttesenSCG-928-M06]
MANFNNSLKSLVNQQMIAQVAKTLGEKEASISTAVSTIIPSFLGVLLKKKGHSPQIENILHEAGNLDLISEIENLCEEKPTEDQRRIGDDFLQHLLGDKAADFTNPIADKADISRVATNRLISMIAPIVVGYMGNKLVKENWTKAQLFEEIEKEKSYFQTAIPSDLIKSFGLTTVLNAIPRKTEPEKSKSKSWIAWLIILLLLLLLFFGWRSCSKKNTEVATVESIITTETVEPIKTNVSAMLDMTDITLPDGTVLQVYKDGVEERMIKFMESDEYKGATEDQLKGKWFEFDNIDFVFNSTTELKPESQKQLENIVAILKSAPNAKIIVAGFADKKGTEKVNDHISVERAKTIETILENKGVGSQVVKAEGFGERYAKHSVSETDEQRAEDRDVALRFTK